MMLDAGGVVDCFNGPISGCGRDQDGSPMNEARASAGPVFTMPERPDPAPILSMHRGNDGFVAFLRKDASGRIQRVMSVRASELPSVFPEFIAPHVDEESYFSVNSMFLSKSRQAFRSSVDPSFPNAQWGGDMLRWLTASYIDLDCYSMGLSIGQCVGMVIDAQDRGAIPPASIITRSGRGVWLFWLLRDDEGNGPVRAWPEAVSTYRRIERQLHRMFFKLGGDAQALDPTRITRVPGSMHRAAQVRVDYWLQLDQNRQAITYRLDELAARVGARPTKYSTGLAKAVDPRRSEAARKGYNALQRSRLEKFLLVLGERGKIEKGCRARAALLFLSFMRAAKLADDEIRAEITKFGRGQCSPPLNDREIQDVLSSLDTSGWIKYENYTIGDWLKITPGESERVGWPAAGTRPADADTKLRTKADNTITRREMVRAFITKLGGEVPALHVLMALIERQMGSKPSSRTMQRDLVALGIVNPRAWKGRKDQTDPDQARLLD